MKKYFVASDIHSFYTPFIKELNKTGFDLNNEEQNYNCDITYSLLIGGFSIGAICLCYYYCLKIPQRLLDLKKLKEEIKNDNEKGKSFLPNDYLTSIFKICLCQFVSW